MSGLSKPMASICETTPSFWAPMANADGSPNAVPSPPAPAGEGVSGACVVAAVGAAGAAGAAGVDAGATAGVEGALEEAPAADDGAAFGYIPPHTQSDKRVEEVPKITELIYLGDHADYEALLLNIIRLDRVVIL